MFCFVPLEDSASLRHLRRGPESPGVRSLHLQCGRQSCDSAVFALWIRSLLVFLPRSPRPAAHRCVHPARSEPSCVQPGILSAVLCSSFLPSFLLVLLYYIVFSSLAYCVCCTWILLKPFCDSYSLIKSWVDFLDLKTIKNYMCLNSLVSGGCVTRELCIPAGSWGSSSLWTL